MGHGAHGRRHAHAQVGHARPALRQFQHGAALHQRAGVEHRLGADAVVMGLEGLATPGLQVAVVFLFAEGDAVQLGVAVHDHVVDQDARHANGCQGFVVVDQFTHLRDDDAPAVACRLRERQQFMVEGLAMRAEVAPGV